VSINSSKDNKGLLKVLETLRVSYVSNSTFGTAVQVGYFLREQRFFGLFKYKVYIQLNVPTNAFYCMN